MKFYTATLAATSALCLSMGAAYAGSGNQSYLDQSGSTNSASIDQAAGNNNQAGSTGQNVTQGGDWNTLTIDQSGNNGSIGLSSNADAGVGVTQTRANNSTSPDKKSNTMSLTQTTDGNTIGSAVQNSSGQGYNTLTITQGGDGNNSVNSVYQRQSSSVTNIATITQDGNDNTLARVSQNARVGGSYNPNEITITMSGDDNGGEAFTIGGPAAASGALSSNLLQGTDLGVKGNKIKIAVGGTSNEFGISQYGAYNSAEGISLSGTSNELGIYQDGTSNSVALGSITGANNLFGVRQNGTDNYVSLTATGDENGGYHGFTSGNIADTLALANGMTAGLIDQNGTANSTILTISGSGNVFATLQDNSSAGSLGNKISGTQNNTGATGNQVAVAQVGDNNHGNFNQVGSGNVATVTQ